MVAIDVRCLKCGERRLIRVEQSPVRADHVGGL